MLPSRLRYSVVLCVLALAVQGTVCIAEPLKKPNILFILVDDLAWSDLGCYGHPWHETTNIDRLAASGIRMTSGYAPAPICSASRASILTGKTTARLGFEFVTKAEPGHQTIEGSVRLQTPKFTLNLPLKEKTVADHLTELGYETAFFGKWHLNQHHERYLGWSPTHGPADQGFQVAVEDFGAHPYSWKEAPPAAIQRPGKYAPDSMVDGVCDYLSGKRDKPFFAMASSFYVHTPVKTPCEWLVDDYDNKIPAGIKNRTRRVNYAAFLQTLDHHVGRMLDALDSGGKRDDTLIVFMSDNGGHPEYTANGPLRGSKWNLYEGGIRVPFFAVWPGRIAAGTTSDVPVIGYDLLPTFVDLAGGQAVEVDGVPIGDLLLGGSTFAERDLVWHFPYYHPERGYAKAKGTIGVDDFAVSKTRPQSAMRRGKHKLLWFAEDDRVELYDLETDPSEQRDLSKASREITGVWTTRMRKTLSQMKARLATKSVREDAK